MRIRFLFFLLLPFLGASQNQLLVSVKGVAHSKGNINIALYDQEGGFLDFDKVFKSTSMRSEKGMTTLVFEDIPEGEYALAVFHDENGNDKLDVNWVGIPKEPVCFSNARMKTFGPPSFKDCAFKVESDKEIAVSFSSK